MRSGWRLEPVSRSSVIRGSARLYDPAVALTVAVGVPLQVLRRPNHDGRACTRGRQDSHQEDSRVLPDQFWGEELFAAVCLVRPLCFWVAGRPPALTYLVHSSQDLFACHTARRSTAHRSRIRFAVRICCCCCLGSKHARSQGQGGVSCA